MAKGFVIRDTPAWLDQHQSWISDGARLLYKTLRTLADAKTGRLFIPGRGWIRRGCGVRYGFGGNCLFLELHKLLSLHRGSRRGLVAPDFSQEGGTVSFHSYI